MVTEIWVNFGSGNGLLPDGTKPLPEPMLTDHHLKSSDIHSRAISQEMPQPSITKIHWKITYLKFHSNFPGANELISKTQPILLAILGGACRVCCSECLLIVQKLSFVFKPFSLVRLLTQWARDKMAAISQTTYSNAFSGMKMYEFPLTFHWSLFLRFELTILCIGSDNGLALTRQQAIIWTNDG